MQIKQRVMIQIKRVYEPEAKSDGQRFLVERLWPRGVKKTELPMVAWLKEVAPRHGTPAMVQSRSAQMEGISEALLRRAERQTRNLAAAVGGGEKRQSYATFQRA